MPAADPALGWQRYSFVIAGVQKAGTSSLSALLNEHPNIRRAPRKEIHFFDRETRDWSRTDHDDYRVPRRRASHLHLGDASPRYLMWPKALERMHAYDPDLRLIAMFRDPLDRLFSNWMMDRNRSAPDWPEFIRWRPTELPDRVPPGPDGRPDAYGFYARSGVLRGYYGSQVERALGWFPRHQWLFLEFDSFFADHVSALDAVTDHLGLPRFEPAPALRKLWASQEVVAGTAPTASDLEQLAERYAPEIEKHHALTGLPVDHWNTVRLLAGDLSAEELAGRYAAKAGLSR